MQEQTVFDYIKNDRQWTRPCRLAHAKYQLRHAESTEDQSFWKGVIRANVLSPREAKDAGA